jgi:Chlorophyllase enzyme
MTYLIRAICALILAFAFAACGGGGASDDQGAQTGAPKSGGGTNGPVGGTVTPFVSANPPASSASGTASPVTPATSASNFIPSLRFLTRAPDETADALYQPAAKDYNLGSVAVSTTGGTVFLSRVHGGVWYPDRALAAGGSLPSKYPVVVLLHGMHPSTVPSYQGYEYLARDLAAHGFIAVSIDANDINDAGASGYSGSWSSNGDYSSQSRAQLVLATLDRFKQISQYGTVDKNLNALIGKIDFDRVGITGHSRGGQGIDDAIKLNGQRIGVTLQQLRGALSNLQTEAQNLTSAVWSNAPVAQGGNGSSGEFLPTLQDLITKLGTTPSDADLQATLTKDLITLAAGPGTSPSSADAPPVYTFKAALALAPTDGADYRNISNVPYAALVGSCDGDVSTLDGAHVFDNNRFGQGASDSAPRFQIFVRGANHNYFNTIWTNDDWMPAGSPGDYCFQHSLNTTAVRLDATDQQAAGLFLINSFMRYFVNGEAQFAPYWNGTAALPTSACPAGQTSCDKRVLLTVQMNGQTSGVNSHKLIEPFSDNYTFDQPYDSSTSSLQMGGPLSLIDTSAFSNAVYVCAQQFTFETSSGAAPTCTPAAPYGFFMPSTWTGPGMSTRTGGMLSIANELLLTLTHPTDLKTDSKSLPIALKEPAAGAVTTADLSTAGYDTLSFRTALVSGSAQSQTVDVSVTLTDSNGVVSAPLKVSDFSDALNVDIGLPDLPVGNRAQLLSMVAIPLSAFTAGDPTHGAFNAAHLKNMTLTFSNIPVDVGTLGLTDLELQNMGRAKN